MPLVESDYQPPLGFRNGHWQTIYASLFRRVPDVVYRREQIDTPDDDFLDLDWVKTGADRVVILSHGLEGSTQRSYIRGMARALSQCRWDVIAWNYRGCGGTPNRQLRSYHSGATEDLEVVVQHALAMEYEQVALVGFSLGGNLTLKYLGERGAELDSRICAAATFSVPTDLDAGSAHLDGRSNWIYAKRFLVNLREKVRQKRTQYPDALPGYDEAAITSLRAFDDCYTAPLHGFADAADYYAQSSSKPFIADIAVPTLIVNAADDPFLPEACYPVGETRDHPHVFLETPARGGHVGFVAFHPDKMFWSEQRAIGFLDTVC
jgi:predicted alpha/beta-fold hydrolase